MKVWGTIESPNKIEFISYSPEYHHQVLEVIRKAFFVNETVSIASGIDKNLEAQRDLELLCEDVLKRSGVSLIARDVEKNLIVGAALNVIQVREPSSDAPSYFETFRDLHCKTDNAKSLMNYMIVADSKVDAFELFKVDSLLEIMFLATLEEYGNRGIGFNLCKYSIELARDLKNRKDVEIYLSQGQPQPKLVTALWTGRYTQAIGKKLKFQVIFEESFKNFSFNDKNFAEAVGDLDLNYEVVAKTL